MSYSRSEEACISRVSFLSCRAALPGGSNFHLITYLSGTEEPQIEMLISRAWFRFERKKEKKRKGKKKEEKRNQRFRSTIKFAMANPFEMANVSPPPSRRLKLIGLTCHFVKVRFGRSEFSTLRNNGLSNY